MLNSIFIATVTISIIDQLTLTRSPNVFFCVWLVVVLKSRIGLRTLETTEHIFHFSVPPF